MGEGRQLYKQVNADLHMYGGLKMGLNWILSLILPEVPCGPQWAQELSSGGKNAIGWVERTVFF